MNKGDFDNSNFNDDPTTENIFNLKQLKLNIPNSEFTGIGICPKYMIFANRKNEIFRWIYDNKEDSLRNAYNIPLPEKERGLSTKFYCDQKGYHCIFKHNRYYFYFNFKSEKIKLLTKFNDINIESIAFDESNSESSTNTILIGTDKGRIYGYQLDYDIRTDKVTEKITEYIKLKSEKSIYGIAFETYKEKNLSYVIAITDSQLYQFMGSSNLEQLFNKYKLNENTPKYLENTCKIFPEGDLNRSMLQMYIKKDGFFQSFGWMTAAGFCYGNYPSEVFEKLINNFIIVPYVKIKKENGGGLEIDENPIAVAHSEFHIFLLYSDCITIVSKITSNIVQTIYLYDLNSTNNNISYGLVSMMYDKSNSCLFLNSAKSIYQLQIENEGRDIWKAYLEKEDYENALNHCKQNNLLAQQKKVSKLYASSLFDKGEFARSALHYGESNERFEEVALKFLVKNQYEALKTYLDSVDKKLPPKTSATQKTLLATWLTEIYLHELNNTNNSINYTSLKNKFKAFMIEKNNYLDTQTIYQLLHYYGRTMEFLDFAEMKQDYETVILHYVNEKQYDKAIDKLHNFLRSDKSRKEGNDNILCNIFSKYSHIFMKFQPELTIEKLLKNFRTSLDQNRIISAIMNTDDSKKDKVADYLEELIEKKIKDKNIHNLYIFFLAKLNSETSINKLLVYLEKSLENRKVDFEVDYAIKIFAQFRIPPAQALALAILTKYDEAIKIALENGYPLTAKKIAKFVDDSKIKKLLWLEIFQHEVREQSIKSKNEEENEKNFNYAIDLMTESEVLKIEDILPKLMDNIKIEVFKKEITRCINSYENSIDSLKTKISLFNETAKNVKCDINKVKKKHMEVRYQQCICEICNNTIREDNVFIFPCGHLFDGECLFNQIRQYANCLVYLQPKVEKLLIGKSEIDNLEKKKTQSNISTSNDKDDRGTFFSFRGFGNDNTKQKSNAARRISISTEELKKLEEYKSLYNELLCEECVLCGDMMIESINKPFLSANNKDSWAIL